jgi:A/G-specific adenine glycosylase
MRDPYAILVSEFMLQQTQVATVLPYYRSWLQRFPDFNTLARASENEILHAWQALGYYNRARNLHAAAKIVQYRHGGGFPTDIRTIRALPGVGRYTANAIATFAFDCSAPIVEANTARVLARVFDIATPIDSAIGRETLWNRATQLIPKKNAARFNSALLDLGALICLPRKPKCGLCPVHKFCRAADPEILPVKKTRARWKQLTEGHAFVLNQNRILLEQSTERWRGMWILPRLKRVGSARPIHVLVFSFTNHRITLKVFCSRAGRAEHARRWFSPSQLNSIPIPSPHRRAIVALLSAPRATRPHWRQLSVGS